VGLPNEIVEPASVMVSELATNCVRHAKTDLTVTIEQSSRQIRVDIADGGAGSITMRHPEASEPTGRGLRIVDRLSDAWGVAEFADRDGKDVWFRLSLPG